MANASVEKLKALGREEDFEFPFGYDESQAVAKAYTAACTPDPDTASTERG